MLNTFRIIGDGMHLFAKCFVVFQLLRNQSCSGISAKTQLLFAITVLSRYLDIFSKFYSYYNTIFKALYIALAFFTVYLTYGKYRTEQTKKEDSFKYAETLIILCGLMALLINQELTVLEVLWTFSEFLAAVSIIPQLYLFFKNNGKGQFTNYYVMILSLYRVFYMANWGYRYQLEGHYDLISISCGIVGLAILCSIAWSGAYKFLINMFEKTPSNFNKAYLTNITTISHPDMYAYNDLEPLKKCDIDLNRK